MTTGAVRHERPTSEDWCGTAPEGAPTLIGRSPSMVALRQRILCVARSPRPVLLCGPSGAGKEVAAQAIHYWSERPGEAPVDVNCGAIPENTAESELFGHERGAFTGAERRRDGLLNEARGGTVFFDEVTELSPRVQVKLLRVLETGRFRPMGGGAEQVFSARVIAATNADLAALVRKGAFREDLYYRLRVLPVEIPALATRREDVPLLADHFLRRDGGAHRLTAAARLALSAFDWPGNVRQLRNVTERLVLFADGDLIDDAAVRRELACEEQGRERGAYADEVLGLVRALLDGPSRNKLDEVERALFDEALRRAAGNKSEAARLLGVHRKVVERWLARGAACSNSTRPPAFALV